MAAAAGIGRWQVAWQSAGRTPEPWLGPDVARRRAPAGPTVAHRRRRGVPLGFVADHLEVLYDLDIELAAAAAESGLRFARTASLNDDPAFIDVLAGVVCTAASAGLSRASVAVVVVGGGISGLAAAWELTGGPGAGRDRPRPRSSSWSRRPAWGACCRASCSGVARSISAADGFLGRRPEALDLCQQLGLGAALVPIGSRGAGVWARGQVRPLPEGLALGIPTRFWPSARSGILGARGQVGLARDALLPRPDRRGPIGDRSVGPLVARKLGQRVVDRLVDPLIGGIHAGSVDDMSTAAVFPPLLAAAQGHGSLMRALRREVPAPDPDAPPLFWAIDGGMSALVERLGTILVARGATILRARDRSRRWCGTAAPGPCEARERTPRRSRPTPSWWPPRPPRPTVSLALTTTRSAASSTLSTTPR